MTPFPEELAQHVLYERVRLEAIQPATLEGEIVWTWRVADRVGTSTTYAAAATALTAAISELARERAKTAVTDGGDE
jgi:hypothetical protein